MLWSPALPSCCMEQLILMLKWLTAVLSNSKFQAIQPCTTQQFIHTDYKVFLFYHQVDRNIHWLCDIDITIREKEMTYLAILRYYCLVIPLKTEDNKIIFVYVSYIYWHISYYKLIEKFSIDLFIYLNIIAITAKICIRKYIFKIYVIFKTKIMKRAAHSRMKHKIFMDIFHFITQNNTKICTQ
jgi:hypothetical protein